MSSPEESPLLSVLAELGLEILQDEIRDRCERLEDTPMGKMWLEAQRRRAQLQADGRAATTQDVRDYLRTISPIVREAAAARRRQDEE